MRNQILFLMLVMLLCISPSFVSAECDPQDPSFYSDPGCYKQVSPSQWDYQQVDWSLVDFSDPQVYSAPTFYENLPDDKYGSLDYHQVDYALIRDHDKIDTDKYLSDMGAGGSSIERGGQNLEFSASGITHPDGGFVSIPGNYPAGTLFLATSERIEVHIPEGTTFLDIPTTDTLTLESNHQITLSDGTVFSGKISSSDGRLFVKARDSAEVNGIRISADVLDVALYYDGLAHADDYVSFGEQKVIIHGFGFKTEFLPNNKYVNVEEGDRLVVSPLNDGMISITQHGANLAPTVEVTGPIDVQEWARIENGKYDAVLGNKGMVKLDVSEFLTSEEGSVPMEVKVLDDKGKSLIVGEDGREGKLVFGNDGSMNYATMDTIVDSSGASSCNDPGESSTAAVILEVTGNDILDDAYGAICDRLYGVNAANAVVKETTDLVTYLHYYGIQFDFDSTDDLFKDLSVKEVRQIKANLETLRMEYPALFYSIRKIDLTQQTSEYIQNAASASANMDEGKINIRPKDEYGLSYATLVHEAAHTRHGQILYGGSGDKRVEAVAYAMELDTQISKKYPEKRQDLIARGLRLFDNGLITDAYIDYLGAIIFNDETLNTLYNAYNKVEQEFYGSTAFNNEWYAAQGGGDSQRGENYYQNNNDYIDHNEENPNAISTDADKLGYGSKWKVRGVKMDDSYEAFINAYGAKNVMEDVATYVEEVERTGSVPNLDDPRVQAKVQLLCKYNFLPKTHKLCK